MILPYLLRLLCLCFASFFVLNASASLLVRVLSERAIQFAASKAPGPAARFLLILRLLPFGLATFFVVGLCVPSYLWLEPSAGSEKVGFLCALLGLLGAAAWFISVTRALHSLFASVRHTRRCRLAGRELRLPGEASTAVLIEDEAPLLALTGLLRPRLLISRSVLRSLSAEELDAALRHERAHRTSLDNPKRFLLLFAPDVFPFVHLHLTLERNWTRLAEWAADDRATAGDSSRAVSLAAALVHVARMGSAPRLPFLSTSLLACDRDLSTRVDRLLRSVPIEVPTSQTTQHWLRDVTFVLAGCLGALLLAPSALAAVHELLELLLH